MAERLIKQLLIDLRNDLNDFNSISRDAIRYCIENDISIDKRLSREEQKRILEFITSQIIKKTLGGYENE